VSAHPATGIKSIPELIAYIKANPDKLTYASSGVGQSPHLTGAWFLQLTGLKMVHVPFRGAGPALQAALAGDIQILFDNLYPSLPQTQDGKLTALCVTTPERSPAAPNIPTAAASRKALPLTRPIVIGRGRPFFTASMAASTSSGTPRERAKLLKVPRDRIPSVRSLSARARATKPIVPSPPATTTLACGVSCFRKSRRGSNSITR